MVQIGRDDGQFQAEGDIRINYSQPIYGEIQLDLEYDLDVWQKSCSAPNSLAGEMILNVNATSRLIRSVPKTIGNLILTSRFTHWFLGQSLNQNLPKLFFLEELMYLHGYDPNMQQTFEYEGNHYLPYKGSLVEVKKLAWKGQYLYAGVICGLGMNPFMNISIEYFYEVQSGLLLVANAKITEYLLDTPSVFQTHEFSRYITSFTYEGQPSQTDMNSNPNWTDILDDENPNKDLFLAAITIIGITGLAVMTIIKIHRVGLRRRVQALLELENNPQLLDDPPKNPVNNPDRSAP